MGYTIPTSISPEEIAAKLTAAQRRVVLSGRVPYGKGYWALSNALIAKGLVSAKPRDAATPLGLAVRAVLQDPTHER